LRSFSASVDQVTSLILNMWLVFTNTFSKAEVTYVSNVDIDELYNLSIQNVFIWGHLVAQLTKFDQIKPWILKKYD
jgi:hypothetical protein